MVNIQTILLVKKCKVDASFSLLVGTKWHNGKQAYMAYKLQLNIIVSALWWKAMFFLKSIL